MHARFCLIALSGVVLGWAAPARAGTFFFNTGDPDGLIATPRAR